MQQYQAKEKGGIKGRWTVRMVELSDVVEQKLDELIAAGDRAGFMALVRDHTTRMQVVDNLVALSARAMLAGRLAGTDFTYTGEINYLALGTDNTAVDETQDALLAEMYRKEKNIFSHSDNVATLDWYFTKANVSGTFEEIATYVDGGAGVDSGQMFSRIVTGGWPKTNNEGMVVTVQYTIINA